MTGTLKGVSRRSMLKGGAALGAGLALPTIFTSKAHAYLNEPTGATVTFGFNVPQTGAYADEGADELRAYELAVEHINAGGGGMLDTFSSAALRDAGGGVNGKKVEFVTGDTQTKADAARSSARRMIESDGVVMVTGGSSSSTAVAVQALCQEMGIIFMAGLTHANETTGKDKRRNGFRHFFNSEQSGRALAPILEANYGKERNAYHLTADYNWGWSTQRAVQTYTEQIGWNTVETVLTPLGAGDFSQYLTPVLTSDADTLILNHYGKDMVNSLTQAVQFGLRERQANGKDFVVVVPLYSRLMAQGAGENVQGIFGSTNWHWSLQDEGSQAFVRAFGQKFGFPPSQAAHTCYVQALLYADACQRAGTFNPCGVVEALETKDGYDGGFTEAGFQFDGLGNGPTLYRAADHQCFKPVLVVQGKENPANQFDLLEVVDVASTDAVTYPVDHPDFAGGELGECNPGA